MEVKRWDIILIDFPYTNGSAVKKRPGVAIGVVLNDLGGEDVIVAAISSVENPVGIQVPVNHPEFNLTGLIRSSRIIPAKIFTCAKSEIKAPPRGSLGPQLQREVKKYLRDIFEL